MTAADTQPLTPRKIGWFKWFFYTLLSQTSRMVSVLFFDLRCYGREQLHDGRALVLSTHQSHLDPVLVGMVFNDRLNALARRTLFKNPLLGAIIRLLDAIELDRDRSGLAGLKETLKRLKANQMVLVFPEGTRSSDGQIAPLKPGFLAVARRSQAPLIPLAVTGAFEALPRGSLWPRRYPLRMAIGKPIAFSDYESLSDDDVVALISQRLHRCFDRANASRT